MKKIAFGGGCHWCTEAIFESLCGVNKVDQGWVNATSNRSFREKYRSAIYTFSKEQKNISQMILQEKFLHYYKSNPQKPFCKRYIAPKLQFLLERYGDYAKL